MFVRKIGTFETYRFSIQKKWQGWLGYVPGGQGDRIPVPGH
jgi:hypothetical protein